MQALNRMWSFVNGLLEIVAFYIYSERQTDPAIYFRVDLIENEFLSEES